MWLPGSSETRHVLAWACRPVTEADLKELVEDFQFEMGVFFSILCIFFFHQAPGLSFLWATWTRGQIAELQSIEGFLLQALLYFPSLSAVRWNMWLSHRTQAFEFGPKFRWILPKTLGIERFRLADRLWMNGWMDRLLDWWSCQLRADSVCIQVKQTWNRDVRFPMAVFSGGPWCWKPCKLPPISPPFHEMSKNSAGMLISHPYELQFMDAFWCWSPSSDNAQLLEGLIQNN